MTPKGRPSGLLLAALVAVASVLAVACGGPEINTAELDAFDAYQRGLELQEKGEPRQAFEAFNEALHLNPRLAEAYAGRAAAYYAFDDLGHAMPDILRALQLNPNLAIAHNYQGLIYVEISDPDNALVSYSKAIELDPTLSEAYLNRAQLQFMLQNLEASISDLSFAIELEPDAANLYLTRGQIYLAAEEDDRGIADLEQVLALTENEALTIRAKQLLSLVR